MESDWSIEPDYNQYNQASSERKTGGITWDSLRKGFNHMITKESLDKSWSRHLDYLEWKKTNPGWNPLCGPES
jgi:hypothetical protein